MTINAEFDWQRFPETERWVESQIASAVDSVPFLSTLQARMHAESGTSLLAWIDHFTLGERRTSERELTDLGYHPLAGASDSVWAHDGGMFPTVRLAAGEGLQVAVKVESVSDFLFAHNLHSEIAGAPHSPLRMATVAESGSTSVSIVERHGERGFQAVEVDSNKLADAERWREAFRLRRRDFESDEAGFDALLRMVDQAVEELGVDWAADLFFAGEREYWQRRNRAAQLQWSRQSALGLGWANHDHHTYRCSREHFARLIEVLERLGMTCRERFYGGAEAGWGAQVLEQSAAGIVVFADVDLSASEVTGDFAHQGLQARDTLGTVGLWCKLHGEAILQAGMHHLECQFEFDIARAQLEAAGIDSMAPFTDFDHLKQSFTKGEMWPVAADRIDRALRNGWITAEQADRFRRHGSLGSHLEVLQRRDGYKGFNQTGISEIIRQTDPRRGDVTPSDSVAETPPQQAGF